MHLMVNCPTYLHTYLPTYQTASCSSTLAAWRGKYDQIILRSLAATSASSIVPPGSMVPGYTADFGHSGPRLAIASCGHSGNCTLRHWIRSHDRAQYGSCTLGLVWQLPVWIRMAPHIGICHSGQAGNCHWGPEWLPHGYLLLFYFLYKNEKIRWFPCGT